MDLSLKTGFELGQRIFPLIKQACRCKGCGGQPPAWAMWRDGPGDKDKREGVEIEHIAVHVNRLPAGGHSSAIFLGVGQIEGDPALWVPEEDAFASAEEALSEMDRRNKPEDPGMGLRLVPGGKRRSSR
jgi:hypothetical protein